jgi:hypothetical protein
MRLSQQFYRTRLISRVARHDAQEHVDAIVHGIALTARQETFDFGRWTRLLSETALRLLDVADRLRMGRGSAQPGRPRRQDGQQAKAQSA